MEQTLRGFLNSRSEKEEKSTPEVKKLTQFIDDLVDLKEYVRLIQKENVNLKRKVRKAVKNELSVFTKAAKERRVSTRR